MATIPTPVRLKVLDAIDAWRVGTADNRPRSHLGASSIGISCERRLWYAFRWVAREEFPARILRLFARGHAEENTFNAELRGAGVQVLDVDPATGRQFTFNAAGGHFGGSMDGVALGIPDAPKTWHVLEYKTHSAKSFKELAKKGVKDSKPQHWAQMQAYMHMASLERALYLAANKDDDDLYAERIRYDKAFAESLMEKAERIVFASEPPPKISEDASWFECRFCPMAGVCHGESIAAVSCRTCLHATPENGDARWSCAKWKSDIPTKAQIDGCEKHLYIPALLAKLGEATDASDEHGWVEYTRTDGSTFRNGADGFQSKELTSGEAALIFAADPVVAQLRAQGAVIVEARKE